MVENVSLTELIKNPELRPKSEELDQKIEKIDKPKNQVKVVESGTHNITRINLHRWFVENKSILNESGIKVIEIDIAGVPTEENIGISFPTGEKLEDGTDRRKFVVLSETDNFFVANLPIIGVRLFNKGMVFRTKIDDVTNLTSYITQTSYTVSVEKQVDDLYIPYFVQKENRKSNKPITIPTIQPDELRNKLKDTVNFDLLVILYPQITAAPERSDTWLYYVQYLLDLKEKISSVPHLIQIDSAIAGTVGLSNEN